jgi:hypothetical protein
MTNFIVIALCIVGIQSGDFTCNDTSLISRAYIDCVDDPASPPIGSAERGSGHIQWGSRFGDTFEVDGSATYEWSGWQVLPGGYVRAVIGVDEDVIFRDGHDRQCRQGWF